MSKNKKIKNPLKMKQKDMNEPKLFPHDENSGYRFDRDYYENETFDKLLLTGQVLEEIEFYNCRFNGVVMTNAVLSSSRFEKCSFMNCDLSLIKIRNTLFLNVKFENSKLIGIVWDEVLQPFKVDYLRCKISDSIFTNVDLRSAIIVSCEAHNTDFEGANLAKADLHFSDFLNSSFLNTNLSSADFSGAVNYRIDPTKNKIKKAKFTLPEAISLLDKWDVDIN